MGDGWWAVGDEWRAVGDGRKVGECGSYWAKVAAGNFEVAVGR